MEKRELIERCLNAKDSKNNLKQLGCKVYSRKVYKCEDCSFATFIRYPNGGIR